MWCKGKKKIVGVLDIVNIIFTGLSAILSVFIVGKNQRKKKKNFRRRMEKENKTTRHELSAKKIRRGKNNLVEEGGQ